MNIISNRPTNTSENEINKSTGFTETTIGRCAQNWLASQLPPKIQLGIPSITTHLRQWETAANYVIAGRPGTGAGALALTLAENFSASGGHVIWVGVTEDLGQICERLMFRIAGLTLDPACTHVELDAISQIKLAYANEQVRNMWADFCNVEDCGDVDLEASFMASVSSFKPTLIVVEQSIFDETTLDPFEMLVRQTHALRMVEELRKASPLSSVIWQLPLARAERLIMPRPSLADLPDAARAVKPDVVLFTHSLEGSAALHNAELIIATNAYGPTGVTKMNFAEKYSTWHEFVAAK